MATLSAHKKIIIDDSILGNVSFADYYRFGDADGPVPMVCYIGGSISLQKYLGRLKTPPEPLVNEFAAVWQKSGIPAVDFLVSSAPPNGEGRTNGVLRDFFSHLLFELLPRTDNPRPSALAFIGYSFGAHLASYLNFTLAGSKSLVTIGGCGMAEAAQETPLHQIENKRIMVCSNQGDGTEYDDEQFEQFLISKGLTATIEQRPGGHAFDDYLSNGSIADAFGFVLRGLG